MELMDMTTCYTPPSAALCLQHMCPCVFGAKTEGRGSNFPLVCPIWHTLAFNPGCSKTGLAVQIESLVHNNSDDDDQSLQRVVHR